VDFISHFVQSLSVQYVPAGVSLEVLIADGRSNDGTREELDRLPRCNPSIRVIDNPGQTAAAGLNGAIRQARGDVFIRMDVHTSYAPDYILECLRALESSRADNVGGPWVARGSGFVSEAIALAFSSLLISGGGKAHRATYEGPVDTVYLGCWPRRTFERFGFFDEAFVRTQDSEHNLRINLGGGTVWQTPSIQSRYSPRSSLRGLAQQYAQYGYWKAKVLQKHNRLASLRQWAPGLFLVSLLLAGVLSVFLKGAASVAIVLMTAYFTAAAVGTAVICAARGTRRFIPLMPVIIGIHHFSFGYGFLRGFWDFVVLRKRGSQRLCALTRESRSQRRSGKSAAKPARAI
jgi:glycosyltransferase involved in cell wall biosynthesis